MAAYVIWEAYWYSKIGLGFVKWHTHLMPFVLLWVSGLLIYTSWGRRSARAGDYFLAFSMIVFTLLISESLLMAFGINRTYSERSGYYASCYAPDVSRYHIWPPGRPHMLTEPEFSYARPTNSLGFADEEWSLSKRPKEKRILALGDSFTEGYGAASDSDYVSDMRRLLRLSGDSVYTVMNGGICGSDPFNNYINLSGLLLGYRPDIIIQSIRSSDLCDDILTRGGIERFRPDGTVKGLPAPHPEFLYAVSYISRLFYHAAGYDARMRDHDITPAERARIDASVVDLLARYDTLCREHHIRLYIVLSPEKEELKHNKYAWDFSPEKRFLVSHPAIRVIDLMPGYRAYIEARRAPIDDYFWQLDMHPNARGYKMMAETLYQNLYPMIDSTAVEQ
jgi:lysophospholipase L1-like esterase